MKKILILIGMIGLLVACNTLRTVLLDQTAYEKYLSSLEKAGLNRNSMVVNWRNAGMAVFSDSITILQLPYRETGYFPVAIAQARGFRFKMKKGQILSTDGATQQTTDARIFCDLFVWKDNTWKHIAEADSGLSLRREFDEDAICLIRVQPELLTNMYYSITLSLSPVLSNPVSGAINHSIGSLYGVSRDAGKRSHEGIDIFAKRGTPVIAPANGIITSTASNNLGGKVIWMSDVKRGLTYYFAHLDSQFVSTGTIVKTGDTIGSVGNTGNARLTSPHLHFGIYKNGSRDPLHYVQTITLLKGNAKDIDTTLVPLSVYITLKEAKLRTGPGETYQTKSLLPKQTYLSILAQSDGWYRVELPDHTQGYISRTLTTIPVKLKPLHVQAASALLSEASDTAAPLWYFEQQTVVIPFAYFGSFAFVQTQDGKRGWIQM